MTRISLVLGGGGSLGAYSAGAMVEILTALDENEAAGKVSLDVVTGSGTGGLAAALAARSLAVNPNLLPWVEKAWVEGLGVRTLTNPERSDRRGVADVRALHQLVTAMVAGEPASDDRASDALGGPLRVGVALARLDGRYRSLPVDASKRDGPTFAFPDPGEDLTLTFEAGAEARHPGWGTLRDAAVASFGAPLLLPPVSLAGLVAGGGEGEEAPGASTEVACTGSGAAVGRPLSLARQLARGDHGGDGEARRYVVVAPRLRDDPAELPPSRGEPGTAAAAGARLAGQLLGGGAVRDWVEAAGDRARGQVLRALVKRLPELHDRFEDPDAVGLGRYIGELAERVAEREVERRPEGWADSVGDPVLHCLDEHIQRIQSEPAYAPAFEQTDSRAGRTRLAKLVYVLEALGGMEGPVSPDLHLVAPREPEPLAGEALGGLGGFLCRAWRRHDYTAGRRDARRLLEGPLADLVSHPGDDRASYEPDEVPRTVRDLPGRDRRDLERWLEAEADRLLSRLRPGGLGRLFWWAVRPGLRTTLRDRVLEGLQRAD